MTRVWKRWLWAVLALALVLRLGFGLSRGGLDMASDERHWDGVGRAFWLSGLVHSDAGTYRPPLYPLALAATYAVVGHRPSAVRVWQALLGTATCGLLFLLGCRTGGGERVGLLAALGGACYPLLVLFSGVVMAETLLVFLTLACLWAWVRYLNRPSTLSALAFGALAGLAALTKPVILAWIPLALLGWLVSERPAVDRRLRDAAMAGMVALAVIAPWTLRNQALTGHWVLISSNLGMNLMVGNEPDADGTYGEGKDYLAMFGEMASAAADPVAGDRVVMGLTIRHMQANLLRTLALTGKKVLLFWSPVMPGESWVRNGILAPLSAVVIVLGLMGLRGLRAESIAWPVATLALSFTLVHAVFFAHVRFRLPVDAALLPMAAWMAVRLYDRAVTRGAA